MATILKKSVPSVLLSNFLYFKPNLKAGRLEVGSSWVANIEKSFIFLDTFISKMGEA